MLLEEDVSFFLVSASAICPHDAWKAASDLFNLSPKINGVKLGKIEVFTASGKAAATGDLYALDGPPGNVVGPGRKHRRKLLIS